MSWGGRRPSQYERYVTWKEFNKKVGQIMADISALQASVAAEAAEVQAVVNEIARVDAVVTALEAAGPGSITQAQIDDLRSAVDASVSAQTAAVAASQTAVPPTP